MIKMLLKLNTFLSMFLKLCILRHNFIIQLNPNIISLFLNSSITERIFYSVPKRIFFLISYILIKDNCVHNGSIISVYKYLFLVNEKYFRFDSVSEQNATVGESTETLHISTLCRVSSFDTQQKLRLDKGISMYIFLWQRGFLQE